MSVYLVEHYVLLTIYLTTTETAEALRAKINNEIGEINDPIHKPKILADHNGQTIAVQVAVKCPSNDVDPWEQGRKTVYEVMSRAGLFSASPDELIGYTFVYQASQADETYKTVELLNDSNKQAINQCKTLLGRVIVPLSSTFGSFEFNVKDGSKPSIHHQLLSRPVPPKHNSPIDGMTYVTINYKRTEVHQQANLWWLYNEDTHRSDFGNTDVIIHKGYWVHRLIERLRPSYKDAIEQLQDSIQRLFDDNSMDSSKFAELTEQVATHYSELSNRKHKITKHQIHLEKYRHNLDNWIRRLELQDFTDVVNDFNTFARDIELLQVQGDLTLGTADSKVQVANIAQTKKANEQQRIANEQQEEIKEKQERLYGLLGAIGSAVVVFDVFDREVIGESLDSMNWDVLGNTTLVFFGIQLILTFVAIAIIGIIRWIGSHNKRKRKK